MLSTPFLMEHTARMASMWSADAMSVSCPRTSRSAGRSLASRHAGASLQRSAAFLTDLVIVTVMRSQPSDRVSCSLRQPPSAFEPSAGSSGIDGSVARELGLFNDVRANCGMAALSVSVVVSFRRRSGRARLAGAP